MVAGALAVHTGHMTGGTTATIFVTGAAGFIGTALVRVLLAGGHEVYGLTPSAGAARHVRRLGAVSVLGDLRDSGQWQDPAGTERVFDVPPHMMCRRRLSRTAAASMARTRVLMDEHLMGGARGRRDAAHCLRRGRECVWRDRTAADHRGCPPRPSARGRCLRPALDRLDGYIASGLPIVTGVPGWVDGNGSWCRERIIEPVMAGRPVLQIGAATPWDSPILV